MSTSTDDHGEQRRPNLNIFAGRIISWSWAKLVMIPLVALLLVGLIVLFVTVFVPADVFLDKFLFPELIVHLLLMLAIFLSLLGIAIAWEIFVSQGRWTWLRVAQAPAKAMMRGDRNAADRALRKALAYARRFAADDRRRGAILSELGRFLNDQGRPKEAIALFEEGVELLRRAPKRNTVDLTHFANAHFNYSSCFVEHRDFASAQRILECVVDSMFAAKRKEDIVFLQGAQVRVIEVAMHVNLADLLLEAGDLNSAKAHITAIDHLIPLLPVRMQDQYYDSCRLLIAYCEFVSGNLEASWAQLANLQNTDSPSCQRALAKVPLARGEYSTAEALLRKHREKTSKTGTLHRPYMFDPSLDLAEALFARAYSQKGAVWNARG